jgi:uncharacterized protein YcfJ
MDKSVIKGAVIGVASAAVVGALGMTGYKAMSSPGYADVIAVKEVTETTESPREECKDVMVTKKAPVQDQHRVAGTVIGAAAGGMIGSTIGGGTGRTIATVGGAAVGGYVGNRVQKNMQDRDVVQTQEKRCKTVIDTSVKTLGYDVSYRLDGEDGVVRVAKHPGPQIPVKNGKLVLDNLQGT